MPRVERFAILSHTTPPSPSVHAMVLHRLLEGVPEGRYFLIRSGKGDAGEAARPLPDLPAVRYELRQAFRQKILYRFNWILPSVAVNALFAIASRAFQVARILKKERCDLLIACTGDLHDLPAACLAARWAGVPFVPYLLDDYAFQWTGAYRTVARSLEPAIVKSARTLIVPNEFLRREYLVRHGTDSVVVHNPCPMPDLDALDRMPPAFPGGINIVFTGTVYHAHYDAFLNLLAALRRLGRDDIRLHVYTSQPESHLEKAGISGPGVVCHSHIPPPEVARVLRHADILFLPLAFDSAIPEVIRTSAPGKTGEYLAAGRPVLVHAPADSFVSWYFRNNRCGVVVDRCTPEALAEGIERLVADREAVRDMSLAARRMAERDFTVETATAVFYEFLDSVGTRRSQRNSQA